VKLPLNAITPADLRRELLVKGISDWSVERMCEQSISKGGIVLLHLEECPQEPKLQKDLFSLVMSMVDVLLTRYPSARPALLQIVTSNYPPIEVHID
jgi:hypothetical protein